jgi:hypothetical protein
MWLTSPCLVQMVHYRVINAGHIVVEEDRTADLTANHVNAGDGLYEP